MKLKVVFTTDITGMSKDVSETIYLKTVVCLYCCHDRENRFLNEIKRNLENKGYDLNYFKLFKVYSI